MGVRDYVETLMVTTEKFFLSQGVQVFRKDEPGLYTDKGKIAFFGIQVRRGNTQHGLALNLENDLQVFRQIAVCGVAGESLDRLENHCAIKDLKSQFEKWCEVFAREGFELSHQ